MGKERITFSTRRFLVGKAGPFPRLVFREEVMLAIDQFSHLHSLGEHGGFLVGRKQELKSAEQYELMVERFVPIPQKSDASRLVINQDHYRTVQMALKAGEEILGWVHTHPGFGVFLSKLDREQHQRFFPKPWQVAYVMDTQGSERAAYRVVDGEWSRLDGYYVLRDMAENEVGIALDRPSPWLRMVVAVLIVFLLILGGTAGYSIIRDMYFQPEPPPQPLTQTAMEPDPVVTMQPVQPESAPRRESPAPGTEDSETAAPAWETTTIAPPPTVPRYVEYVVKRGDNLWSIAGELLGDPSLYRLIAEENGISNPNSLQVGDLLRVPTDPSVQ